MYALNAGMRHKSKHLNYLRDTLTLDRKSTRLNSSHLGISYAVFCLKKINCRAQRSDITPYWYAHQLIQLVERWRMASGIGVLAGFHFKVFFLWSFLSDARATPPHPKNPFRYRPFPRE